jgi:hypothetical protein
MKATDAAEAARKSARTSVMLPEDVYAEVQAMATTNDVSVAWVIRHAVLKFLEQHGGQRELPLRIPREGVRALP